MSRFVVQMPPQAKFVVQGGTAPRVVIQAPTRAPAVKIEGGGLRGPIGPEGPQGERGPPGLAGGEIVLPNLSAIFLNAAE